MIIIQVYAPIINVLKEEADKFHNQVQFKINRTWTQDVLLVIGNCSAKVGKKNVGGLQTKMEQESNLFIVNTVFKQPEWYLYTWTSPDRIYRNQIDYIIALKRVKNSIKSIKIMTRCLLRSRSQTAHVQAPSYVKEKGKQSFSIIWSWTYAHHFQGKHQESLWCPEIH